MHMVLMAANASGIMQETKVGKETILIVIKGWEGCILGWEYKTSKMYYQKQSCFAVSKFHGLPLIPPECDVSEGSIT